MKLAYLKIQNFKGLTDFEIDFTDELGRIRPLTVLVGPNGSGKTSVLDAIWFGLMGQMGYRPMRDNFRTEPQYIVTTGQRYAKVTYHITITEEEQGLINAWKNELISLKENKPVGDLSILEGQIEWTYPAQPDYSKPKRDFGGYRYLNGYDWMLLEGRKFANKLWKLSALGLPERSKAGGIYFFAQEREIISSPVLTTPRVSDETDENPEDNIRVLLIDFGLKDKVGRFTYEKSWYKIIQESYNYICSPHKMGDVYARQSDGEYEIEFQDGNGRYYGFDGLSSGERAVLSFMVEYVYKRMQNSIVLIDELEMYLHPGWQMRLLQRLQDLDTSNQFIITTHSPTLRQVAPEESLVEMGALDFPEWQYQSTHEGE